MTNKIITTWSGAIQVELRAMGFAAGFFPWCKGVLPCMSILKDF